MSQRRCALREYVILANILKNSANVTAAMFPQLVRDPVEYLKELG